MKVGIIQSIIGAGGGNDRVLFTVLKILKETNHQVTLYTVGEPRCDIADYNIIKTKKVFPIKLPIFGIYQKMLEPLLAKKAKGEDVVLALTGDLFLPETTTQRIIFYSQNNYADPSKMNTSKYKSGFWKFYYYPYKQIMNKVMKDVKKYNIKFIANSKHVQQQLKDNLDVDSTVIYPPVDLAEFTTAGDTRSKEGIITVTRYSKEKNLEDIVKIIKDIDCVKAIFGSMNKLNQPYHDLIHELTTNTGIMMCTNEPRNEMQKLLSHAKVFLSASDETFGIAVIEAIQSGCIPIVPDTSAHKETVPFVDLRYHPLDLESAKNKVKRALDGDFDMYLPELKKHVAKFDKSYFQKQILEAIIDL